jgi:hypothetical protein
MPTTPPTDAELRQEAEIRLRLLGVDLSTLPTESPNPTNSPTAETVLAACVTALRGLETVAATPKAATPYDPVFYGATALGVEIESDVR